MVVVDEFKLLRQDGKFVQAGRKQIKEGAVVTRAYVESILKDKGNCLHFEIDEEATLEYYEKSKEQIEQHKINTQASKVSAKDIAHALVGGNVAKESVEETDKEIEPSYPKGKPNDNWGENDLKAYLTDKKVDFDARVGRAKLLEVAKDSLKNVESNKD